MVGTLVAIFRKSCHKHRFKFRKQTFDSSWKRISYIAGGAYSSGIVIIRADTNTCTHARPSRMLHLGWHKVPLPIMTIIISEQWEQFWIWNPRPLHLIPWIFVFPYVPANITFEVQFVLLLSWPRPYLLKEDLIPLRGGLEMSLVLIVPGWHFLLSPVVDRYIALS